MKVINGLFLKGLMVILPVTVTIYALMWISTKTEAIFSKFIKSTLGPELYFPGFGIILTFLVVIVVGILVSNFITGRIINWAIGLFDKVPFIKAIYSPLKDLMSLFSGSQNSDLKKVVVVKLEKIGIECLGLVTREEFSDLPEGAIRSSDIVVYIPMSYMLGGFSTIVPRDQVREVDIPVETAFKLAITGWVKAKQND